MDRDGCEMGDWKATLIDCWLKAPDEHSDCVGVPLDVC